MSKSWVVHLIDDDASVRTAFNYALKAAGYGVVTYVNADDFLERGRNQPGVMITDVRMPGMSGTELTRLMRREGSTMPIILMTGHIEGDVQRHELDAPADLILPKPLVLAVVVAEIERLTQGWDDAGPPP